MKLASNLLSKPLSIRHVTVLGDQIYPSFELRIIIRYLSECGHLTWCSELLDELGLTADKLNEPFISAHQAMRALERFTKDFYQPGLGCQIATYYRCQDLGTIGQCVTHCETLGQALNLTVNYYQLLGNFTDMANHLDTSVLTNRMVNVANLPNEIQQFLFELTVSGLSSIGLELSGQAIPIRAVRFQAKLTSEDIEVYREIFACEVTDGAKFDEWDLDLSFSTIPVKTGVQDLDQLESLLTRLEHELNGHKGLVDDIDEILACSAGDYPDPEMLAHALGISGRTLRRKLESLGTNYSALINKVRCQLAIKLILQQNLSNEQLAARVGFSDSANFQHAFKRWTGRAPSYYRLE